MVTRNEYMKMFGLYGQVDRPDDPADEKFMDAVELLSASFYSLYDEPMDEEDGI